jgi:Ca2+-binding EF-hand superfamily protein
MVGARCEQHFGSFDADQNEKLTKDEFAAWPHSRGDAATLFDERDLDHDGTLTRTEFCSPWSTPPAR